MNSPNAQAYNHTNATIIILGIVWRKRECDSKNLGTRITWFRVTVEKIWRKEVQRANWNYGMVQGVYLEIHNIGRTFV
jgi:hypothetical protein